LDDGEEPDAGGCGRALEEGGTFAAEILPRWGAAVLRPVHGGVMEENTKKSSGAMILLAWVLVGVPLTWGVYNTLLNSMKLFQAPAAAVSAPANSAPTK
jgi:hypothetical protein